jgi:hypothetical protein
LPALRIGVDERARMFALELAMGLLLGLGFFQRDDPNKSAALLSPLGMICSLTFWWHRSTARELCGRLGDEVDQAAW